jgi:hypothetical protein
VFVEQILERLGDVITIGGLHLDCGRQHAFWCGE